MARCSVHKTGTGIVSNMITGQKRNVKIVASAGKRMGTNQTFKFEIRNFPFPFITSDIDPRLFENVRSQLVGEDESLTSASPISFWGGRDFI